MVDFKARLASKKPSKPVDPLQLYDSLDRASDKGPPRPSQKEVLKKWHSEFRDNADVIIKLHTGQGKTLIGLVMLQSKLNEGVGPALYLCPNRYLVEQTASQAKQFGIRVMTSEDNPDLPPEFLNSECIYIATAQKLFNGRTKFKTGPQGLPLGAIVLDDCHAITDSIRDNAAISVARGHAVYDGILAMFAPSLEQQGPGTLDDIKAGKFDRTLRVPYWDVIDKEPSLRQLLAENAEEKEIMYTWPLIRDTLACSDIYVSGDAVEICPLSIPIDLFTSFDKAKHRIFMSATVTDDSFLIRSLGVQPEAVQAPITYTKEKWSGEKLIVMPELIDGRLNRGSIISWLGKSNQKRKHGIVVLTTSSRIAQEWGKNGSLVTTADTITATVESLKNGRTSETVAIANRYDGIDLPDSACRILIIDGLPSAMSPSERYLEQVDYHGTSNRERIFRRLEQGLGRSVRGEKDFSAILLIGPKVVSEVRSVANRAHLSPQTRAQLEIGLKVSEMAEQDVNKGTEPLEALRLLLVQVLTRDQAWKDWYKSEMDGADIHPVRPRDVNRYAHEREIDRLIRRKSFQKAVNAMQTLVDQLAQGVAPEENGTLLERLAQLTYLVDKTRALKIQAKAHGLNPYLLLAPEGFASVSEPRDIRQAAAITEVLKEFGSPEVTRIRVDEVTRHLTFGVAADTFEQAMKQLGQLLGFTSGRPEKEYRAGPDNLWSEGTGSAICIECKSEVDLKRAEINKSEIAQLLNSREWVKMHMKPTTLQPVIVIPTKLASREAAGSSDCRVMREPHLATLRKATVDFYREAQSVNLEAKSATQDIDALLKKHGLLISRLLTSFSEEIKYHEIRH